MTKLKKFTLFAPVKWFNQALKCRLALTLVSMTLCAGCAGLNTKSSNLSSHNASATAASTTTSNSASFSFSAPGAYPLDPLTSSELAAAVALVKDSKQVPENVLFPIIALREPEKADVLAFSPGSAFSRKAFLVVFDRAHSRTFEVVADLTKKKIESLKEIPHVQPLIMPEELDLVPKIVRASPEWQQAMKKRGITDLATVMIDPWAPGTLSKAEAPNIRWIRALSYLKVNSNNGYARPIEGVVAVVNMATQKVDKIYDYGMHPIPPEISDFDEKSIGKQRAAPKPFKITQPQGPSFEVHGHEVVWQKWHFRFSVQPREGLVLYRVGYDDSGKIRPILYRAALGEMVVPYGDPSPNWTFRNAFDEGEYGIGRMIDSQEPNLDAPENATFFDAELTDDFGVPFTMPRSVALYERDGGLLWKHYEFYAKKSDSRRGRELVLSTIVTVGNYDYGFNWIFRQDGSLELQAILTGIMLSKGVDIKNLAELKYGAHSAAHSWHLVAPYVAAPHHQHFFNFRLDFDIDGPKNSAEELNVQSLPSGIGNPANNAFTMTETPFKTEKQARRKMDPLMNRKWIITSSDEKNNLGYPTGYALLPGDNAVPYILPQAKVRQRAGFIDNHFWVTPYDTDQMYAAGNYPNQSIGDHGLGLWTQKNRSIENRDIVAWYTFAVTHTPRPEEWPVMPATTAGFKLLPVGFFSKNPALDVPTHSLGEK